MFLQVLLNISDIQKPPKNSDEDCQLMEKARVGGGGCADLPEPAPCVTGRGRTGTSASWFASTCSPCAAGQCENSVFQNNGFSLQCSHHSQTLFYFTEDLAESKQKVNT